MMPQSTRYNAIRSVIMRGVTLVALVIVLCSSLATAQPEPCTEFPDGTAGYDKYLTCAIRWIDLKGASSTEGATFYWEGPSGTGWNQPRLTTNVPGMYTLKITAPNGCYIIDTVYLYDNADTPDLRCEGDYLSCEKTTATTTVYSDPSEGVTYTWYGDGLVGGQGTSSATWDAPGTKKVVVLVEATGCMDSCTTEVTSNGDKPYCSLSAPTHKPECGSTGNELCANVQGAASYEWTVTGDGWSMTGGQGTNCITYTAGAVGTSGTFKLVVTGQNGCKDSCVVVLTCEGQVGEGCTPGYWKNHKFQWDRSGDVASSCVASAISAKAAEFPGEPWSGNGTTGSLYRTTFGLTSAQMTAVGLSANLTLLQAINLGGGGYFQLARHSVAAILSSCAVDYAFNTGSVLQQVHNAIATKTLGNLGNVLDLANNAGCPLDNQQLGGENIVGGSIEEIMPSQYNLSSNYPNPFNPTTVINYEVPEPSYVRLALYNMLGQEVATLVDGVVEAGVRAVEWNASTSNGAVLPSGIYIYKMQATSLTTEKGFQTVKKMMLMK